MGLYQIYLEIPSWIEKGLANGSYVRDAAGIVRHAVGTSQGGNIVAHLHEVSPSFSNMTSVLPSIGLAAMQMASTAYLAHRLTRIESILGDIRTSLYTLDSQVQRILEQQYMSWTKEVSRGMEFLFRGITTPADTRLIEEARTRFISGLGDINHWFLMQTGEQLLEQPRQVEAMLTFGTYALAGEMTCMAKAGDGYTERISILNRQKQLWLGVKEKIGQVPPPTKRIPTLRMLQEHGPALTGWKQAMATDMDKGTSVLEGNAIFLEAFDGMPAKAKDTIIDVLKKDKATQLAIVPKID